MPACRLSEATLTEIRPYEVGDENLSTVFVDYPGANYPRQIEVVLSVDGIPDSGGAGPDRSTHNIIAWGPSAAGLVALRTEAEPGKFPMFNRDHDQGIHGEYKSRRLAMQ